MKTLFAIAMLTVMGALAVPASADGKGASPKVLLVYEDVDDVFMEEIRLRLESQLIEMELPTEVILKKVTLSHKHDDTWQPVLKQIKRPFGTVAILVLSCNRKRCEMTVFPPKGNFHAQVTIAKSDKDREARVTAVVASLRECLLGPLLPELKRLEGEGRSPSLPPAAANAVLLKSPFDAARKEAPPFRPWFWLSGGYQGDHPHPGGHPIHGPFIGVDIMPTNLLGVGLAVGWLGVRRADAAGASASIQRVNTNLALRLLFPIGPAKISISALGRVDTAIVEMNHGGDHGDEHDTRLELSIGGITMWHLPLPKGLNVWVGAGVLVSLIAKPVEVYVTQTDTETAINASTVRMIWSAGIAFSPIRK